MVEFIFFIQNSLGTTGKRLEKAIGTNFPDVPQETYDTVESLQQRLCQPICRHENEILIVLAETHESLEQMAVLKELIEGRRLVMVLPGCGKETLSAAHRLLPRYVSNERDGFEELGSVLKKMIETLRQYEKICGG